MTIEAIFYQGKGTWYDGAIRVWTRGPYSHCELHFGRGHCFGADPDNGTSWRVRDLENNPDWAIVPLPELDHVLAKVLDFAAAEAGCGYDWTGIFFSEVFPFGWQSKDKWFCSEWVVAAVQLGGLLTARKPWRLSPNQTYKLLMERE
jgi:hypothetical protein